MNDIFGYDAGLPEEIREIFMWLCQDVAALHRKWHFYLTLFGDINTTQLLSDLARGSFNIIEETVRNDISLGISRLSDPSKTSRNENISMEALVSRCDEIDNIAELQKEFISKCKPIQKLRNKRLAHNDFKSKIQPIEFPLPSISRSDIDVILELATSILNSIYGYYIDGEFCFTPIMKGDAKTLIYLLKKAKDDIVQ